MISRAKVEELVAKEWRSLNLETSFFNDVVDFALKMYNQGHEDSPHTRDVLDFTSPAKKVVWQQSQHPMNNLEEAAFLAIAKIFGDLLQEKTAEFTRKAINRNVDQANLAEIAEQQEKVIKTLMDDINEAYNLLKAIKTTDNQWHVSKETWLGRVEPLLFED